MPGERILAVDDHPVNLKLVRTLLAAEGYDVRTAASAREALDDIRAAKPRLVLLDLQMPDIDGFELARRLKADAATRDITIVAMTAYAMKGDDERAFAAGCDGYLTKPLDTRTFAARIAEFLGGPGGAAP